MHHRGFKHSPSPVKARVKAAKMKALDMLLFLAGFIQFRQPVWRIEIYWPNRVKDARRPIKTSPMSLTRVAKYICISLYVSLKVVKNICQTRVCDEFNMTHKSRQIYVCIYISLKVSENMCQNTCQWWGQNLMSHWKWQSSWVTKSGKVHGLIEVARVICKKNRASDKWKSLCITKSGMNHVSLSNKFQSSLVTTSCKNVETRASWCVTWRGRVQVILRGEGRKFLLKVGDIMCHFV